MLKASALYIVIIIALVIGVLCSSLIVAAYFYKSQYQKKFRYDQLENNLSSGVNILLANADSGYTNEKTLSLFGNDTDSVSLKQLPWGAYDIGIVKAFIQKDTLYKTFSMANTIDSTKWGALYLIDEDRPFSISGKTTIRGDAFIPKAGVQEAYVDNKAYTGDSRLIIGTRHISQKTLPPLNEKRITQLALCFNLESKTDSVLPKTDSLRESYLAPTHIFNFKKNVKPFRVLLSKATLSCSPTPPLPSALPLY